MQNYQYLVLADLDGTLLNDDGELSEQTIKYVQALNNQKNILFSFNTGRPWHDCEEIYKKLNLKGFISCCNSAFIYNPHTGENFHCFLSKNMCVKLLKSQLMIDFLDSGTILTDKQVIHFDSKNNLSAVNTLLNEKLNVYGIKFFFKNTCNTMGEKMQFIKSFDPLPKITIFSYPGLVNLEIQAGYVVKEFAVKYLSCLYGVKHENVLTFGDNHNDISVMEGVSRSYAVANAINQIKQHAKFISKWTNNEDAVIKEVELFLESKKL